MNILNKLTIKHLTMNKKRSIVTIIGVVLSTALMVGIGLLTSTMREFMIEEIVTNRGDQHMIIYDLPHDNFDLIKDNKNIDKYKIDTTLGFANISKDSNYPLIIVGNGENINEIEMEKGRFPENDKEIIVSNSFLEIQDYKLGDTVKLYVGKRYEDGRELSRIEHSATAEILEGKDYEFKIVGQYFYNGHYSSVGENIYTKVDVNSVDKINVYIAFKNGKKAYDVGSSLLKIVNDEIKYAHEYNDSLIGLQGGSRYDNIMDSLSLFIVIILSLVSIACIIVIYNSFAISIMERKKQFGLFSSIGATKKQIRKTVFFESLVIGGLGIPLGVLSGFFGIWVVIQIINSKLTGMLPFNLRLSVYPLFILIPILFMIVVILISAFIPAKKASKITPIETIRLNDDIKIKGKKLKTNGFAKKLFGIEGELALKNMKRSKGKYRITIVSLFISIVLFISFSSIVNYGLIGSTEILGDLDYDVSLNIYNIDTEKTTELHKTFSKNKYIDKISMMNMYYMTTNFSKNIFQQEYIKTFYKYADTELIDSMVMIISVDKDSYKEMQKELGFTGERPVIINKYNTTLYENNTRKIQVGKVFKEDKNLEIELQYINYGDEVNDYRLKLNNFVYTDKIPFGFKQFTYNGTTNIIIVPDNIEKPISDDRIHGSGFIAIKTDDSKKVKDTYDNLSESMKERIYYTDVNEEMRLIRNMIFVIKLLLYGFITLVTLIGVTSVFNTINTNIALRRKEFSVLRSVGLTPKGFSKMLRFEILIFGLKSLLYALPVSLGVTYLIHKSLLDTVTLDFIVPYQSILICIVGVFVIVTFAMMYSTSKIKNENIIDAIRDENI